MFFFFFFNDTATTEIYTLSLHDALPISECARQGVGGQGELSGTGPALSAGRPRRQPGLFAGRGPVAGVDRKSTRLNSSHLVISYAVFCLKKKKTQQHNTRRETIERPAVC